MNSDNNLIFCKYGNHNADVNNFTQSGLTNIYKICRKCKAEQMKKYRKKHNEEYNDRVRVYNKQYMRNLRAKKAQEIEIN